DGTVIQSFDGASWRGRRLVFSAAMRADAPRLGTGALLVIRVDRKVEQGNLFGSPVSAMAMQAGGLVRSSGWVRRSAVVDVPPDADTVVISLAVAGTAACWFGALALGSEPSAVARWPTAPQAAPSHHLPLPALLRQ